MIFRSLIKNMDTETRLLYGILGFLSVYLILCAVFPLPTSKGLDPPARPQRPTLPVGNVLVMSLHPVETR